MPRAVHPLPMTCDEMRAWYGWETLDVVLVTGDAYVDHPSFGVAVIGRVLVAEGWRVGVVSQPQGADDLAVLPAPRLFSGVTAGNLDSVLARRTAAGRIRNDDAYSPGGEAGLRPERASIVYTGWARSAWSGVPVILGGVEASLRRFVHWDHWQEKFRRSILADAKADLLVFGMGETAIRTIARRLDAGAVIADLHALPGTCHLLVGEAPSSPGAIVLPGWEAIASDPVAFAEATHLIHREQDPFRGATLVQDQGWCHLLQSPPAPPLAAAELDGVYELSYTRRAHPAYDAVGGVPALATVRHSLVANRGCCGDCSFCAIAAHQGRIVSSRSPESLLREAEVIAVDPDFHGTIDDVGGPTANLYGYHCAKWEMTGACADKHCLWPEICPSLCGGLADLLAVLKAICDLPAMKHVFVQSGLRHDLLLRDTEDELAALIRDHISGRMKVAPEAADDGTLAAMRKPPWRVFRDFQARYEKVCQRLGLPTQLIPYLVAAHPGEDLADAAEGACRLREAGLEPDQVQEFIPAPMCLATAMQVCGLDPDTGAKLPVTTGARSRRLRKALLHSTRPENRQLILEALERCGRMDLLPKLDGMRREGSKPRRRSGPRR